MTITLYGHDSSHGFLHSLMFDVLINEIIPICFFMCILFIKECKSWVYCYWWVDFFIHIILDANIFEPFMSQDSIYATIKA